MTGILDEFLGEGPEQPPATGDLSGSISRMLRAVAPPVSTSPATGRVVREDQPSSHPVHDPSPLLLLDASCWRDLVSALPPDDLLALIGGSEPALAARVIGALDAAGRAWLNSQEAALERIAPVRYQAVLGRLLALVERQSAAGRITLAAGPVPPEQVVGRDGVAVGAPLPAQPPPGLHRPALPEAIDAIDPTLVEVLAHLVETVRTEPGRVGELASRCANPLIATGLTLVAAGSTPVEIDATLDSASQRWLAARQREAELVHAAFLAMRFGKTGGEFRSQIQAPPP